MSVACFCDGSDAPLHVLSVELELCFGDVVVELLDGLGIVCALLVGDVLAGEVRRALAFCLVPRDVLAPFESVVPSFVRRYEGNNTVIINSFVALMLFNFSFDTSYSTTNDLSTIYVIMLP